MSVVIRYIGAFLLLIFVAFTSCYFGLLMGYFHCNYENYEDEKVIMNEVLDSLDLTSMVDVHPDCQGGVIVLLNEHISPDEERELKSRVSKEFGDRIAERTIRGQTVTDDD